MITSILVYIPAGKIPTASAQAFRDNHIHLLRAVSLAIVFASSFALLLSRLLLAVLREIGEPARKR
jgi:hypothetical protein